MHQIGIFIKKNTLLVLALTTSIFSAAQFDLGYPLIKNYKATDYNGQPQIWGISQDTSGVLYFGNNDGVLILTGKHWQTIPMPNRSIARSITNFKDKMAVGASDEFGFLMKNHDGAYIYKSLLPLLPDSASIFNDVHSIQKIKDTLFFVTEKYIFKYFNNQINVLPTKVPLRLGAFNYNDRLWAYMPGKGLGMLQGNRFIACPTTKELTGRGAVKIIQHNKKPLLISTVGGAYKFTNYEEGCPDIFPQKIACSELLQKSYVFDVAKIKNNYYAFATLRQGVIITDSAFNALRIIDRNAGLANDVCTKVMTDYSGNLWACTQSGISFIELQTPISSIDERVGVETALTAALVYKDKFFYGSNFNLMQAYFDPHKHQRSPEFSPVKGNQSQVWKIDTVNDQILVGQRNGLYKIQNGERVPVFAESGNIWNFIRHPLNPEILLVGGDSLFLFSIKNEKIEYSQTIKTPLKEFRWMVFGPQNYLWVSDSESGIYKIKLNNPATKIEKTDNYGTDDGLPANELNYIWKFNKQILAGTAKGIYVYNSKKDRFEDFKEVNQLINYKPVWLIEPDNKDGFFYVGNKGAGHIIKNEKGNFTHAQTLLNRFNAHILHSLYNYHDSLIFLGFPENAFVYNLAQKQPGRTSFKPVIREFRTTRYDKKEDTTISQQHHPQQAVPEIENGTTIDFLFDAPYFTAPEKNQFSYKLAGFDEKWSEWSQQTHKEYTNLPEGNYTFQLKAKNVFEKQSTQTTVNFTVLPPWYATWWAFLLFLTAFFILLTFSIKIYTYRLRRYNLQLEKIVKERTQEIRAKNKKLAALTEFRKNVSHMIVHDLKNPLNVILGLSEKPFVKEAGQIMLNLVNNILDVQKFEDASMKLQKTENQVARTIKSAIARAHLPAEGKEISIINRVSHQYKTWYDNHLIERVLVNLLTNAIKYTPVGGQIIIEAEPDGDNLKISVTDTGKGIDEKQIKSIFERYTQINPEKLGVTYSTGLGLNFCQMAIEAHNGKIDVKSKVNEGSTFFFTIPEYTTDQDLIAQKDDINEQTTGEINPEQKKDILQQAPEIVNLSVYHRTQLENICNQLDKLTDPNIKNWNKKLRKTVYDCNAETFSQLIKQLKNE